jgi:hypothetical protein
MSAIPATKSLKTNSLHVVAWFAVGVFSIAMALQSAEAQTRGPRIKTDHEIFDFGLVPQYSEVSHVFWLRNVGDETLLIDKLIPNCGCTQAPIDKKEIGPGDSARVELIFGSHNYRGDVEKFAQIISNAQGRAPALTFSAFVVADSVSMGPLEATPRLINLDETMAEEAGGGWVSRFMLKNNGKSPVTVETLDKPDRLVATDGFDGALGPGETTEVTLRFEAGLPSQVFSKSLTFLVSDPAQARLTVPVFKKGGPESSRPEGKATTGSGS